MSEVLADMAIESLAYGGSGLGYHDGKVIFVPQTAPGDRVSIRLVKVKKRFAEGALVELLQPGPGRCEPTCPVFGDCGGCQWQHLPYAQQCHWKYRIFSDLLSRQLPVPSGGVRPLVASPDPWHYRSRVQLKLRRVEQQVVMGFYRRGSHYVVDHRHCAILDRRLNEAAQLFRSWLEAFPLAHRIPQLDLGIGDDGAIRAVLHFLDRDDRQVADYFRPRVAEANISLFLQCGRKDSLRGVNGAEDLHLLVGEPPLKLAYGPGGFAQINLPQNRALVKAVVRAVEQSGARRVLDLYCGMGNLSLPVARKVDAVIGVEDFAPAILKARANALSNGIHNALFHSWPAEGAAGRLAQAQGFDLIMLDPPRSGAYAVIKELLSLRPQHILYISCDPPTLVRDLQPLLHGGYCLEWSQPFDLFPQTHHIESVTLLRHK